MRLTKAKAIKYHRQLWDWISHHPNKLKSEWPEWKRIIDIFGYILHNCFPCQWAIERSGTENWPERCYYCPLDWTHGTRLDNDKDDIISCAYSAFSKKDKYKGLYREWNMLDSPSDRKKKQRLARQIRDLPVRIVRD
jgi:hypothetical protein